MLFCSKANNKKVHSLNLIGILGCLDIGCRFLYLGDIRNKEMIGWCEVNRRGAKMCSSVYIVHKVLEP